MLDGIIPLADKVLTNLMQVHYPSWYEKCISIKYQKKVKKFSEIFSMLAINYNSILPFHIDINDNGMCTIVPVGDWEGGELIISHLGIMLKLIKGQVLMFRSSLLIHKNVLAKGVRFSMVFFSHKNTFKN
jgi:hypothetical protein